MTPRTLPQRGWEKPPQYVIGAPSGISVGFARELDDRGYSVTLAAPREDRLRKLAAELGRTVRAEVITCDVAGPADWARLLGEIANRGLQVATSSTAQSKPKSHKLG
ncbi:SDR family NAD(P)-dependent oxidoreductase [Streptomyces viridiviolaceus]